MNARSQHSAGSPAAALIIANARRKLAMTGSASGSRRFPVVTKPSLTVRRCQEGYRHSPPQKVGGFCSNSVPLDTAIRPDYRLITARLRAAFQSG
jgi:hypothetical protein